MKRRGSRLSAESVNQRLNYSHRGAASLNVKKTSIQDEITIVGEYEYEKQRVCEHRHIFLLPKKTTNCDTLKWKSFKFILVTVIVSK